MISTCTYIVVGMTCDHCVRAVRDEVSRITGVADVDVDLATGRLIVSSEHPIDRKAVVTAVDEVGYAVSP
jgi:copper chaperone CopZ